MSGTRRRRRCSLTKLYRLCHQRLPLNDKTCRWCVGEVWESITNKNYERMRFLVSEGCDYDVIWDNDEVRPLHSAAYFICFLEGQLLHYEHLEHVLLPCIQVAVLVNIILGYCKVICPFLAPCPQTDDLAHRVLGNTLEAEMQIKHANIRFLYKRKNLDWMQRIGNDFTWCSSSSPVISRELALMDQTENLHMPPYESW
jgi:hypothetical protein